MNCCMRKSYAGFSYISAPKGLRNSRLCLVLGRFRPGTGCSPRPPELELPLPELELPLPELELPLPELELPLLW